MPKGYTELIHCDNCGEDFSAAYRRCPFCNAKPGQRPERDDTQDYGEPTGPVDYEPAYDDPPAFRNSGGKRLAGGGGGGGYRRRRSNLPIGTILLYGGTALVIVAAVWIITTKLLPKFFPASASPSPSVEASVSPSPSLRPSPSPSPSVEPTADPTTEPTGDVTPTVPVAVTDEPSVTSAPVSALSLSSIDFTLSPKWPSYQMTVTGATGKVTYSIGSPSVATVSDTGLVTAVANGWTVLTVTDEAGASAKCDVRVAGMPKAETPAATDNGGNSGSSSGSTNTSGAKLSTTDFTLSQKLGYTAQLTVSGGTATSWSSSNEKVATVSSGGLVTGVSKGTATITCTLSDGTTLTSIARVH